MKESSQRILLVTPWYGGHSNGVGIVAETLAQSLNQYGTHCTVVLVARDGWRVKRGVGSAGELIYHACLRERPSSRSFVRSVGYSARKRAFRRVVRHEKPTIVHIHFTTEEYEALIEVLQEEGVPWIVTFHGSDLAPVSLDKPKCLAVTRRLVAGAAAVVTVSQALRSTAARAFPFAETKLYVVYNSVSPLIARAAEGNPERDRDSRSVLFVGNLVERKGVDILLRAWALAASSEGWSLTIAGDGRERSELEALANDLGISNSVRFLGAVAPDDLGRLYAAAAISVVPSRSEAFGLVAAEAMSFSLPVIASRIGGLTEIVSDGQGGVLFPCDDAASLAAALDMLMSDPLQRERMGAAARARAVEHYSPRRHADEYGAVYTLATRARS